MTYVHFEFSADALILTRVHNWAHIMTVLVPARRPRTIGYPGIGATTLGKLLHVCRAPRHAEYLNIDPTGFSGAGYGPSTK
jgi:hypothetical protein